MVKIKKKWGLKEDGFLKRSRRGHPRTRERWLALLWLIQGISQMEVASRLNRSRKIIRDWQKLFEEGGPKALEYKRTGGRRSTLSSEEEKHLAEIVATTHPKDLGLEERRWTLKVASAYCLKQFGKQLTPEGCRCVLKRNGLALKRPKKNSRKPNLKLKFNLFKNSRLSKKTEATTR